MQATFFSVIIPLAGVGVVSFYNQLKAKDYEGAVTIIVAAAIGLVAGLTNYLGLDVQSGLTLALAAVGIHTTATAVSSK